jgi:NMD protein affecting ribosome stability and mRNA decay
MRTDDETIPCKWCGRPTRMLGTKMCDGCWELDHRIQDQPVLARRIFEHYHSKLPVTETK